MNSKTLKLTRGAIMIALSITLSFFKIIELPNGGSVTLGSMVPIILLSFVTDTKWSVFYAFVYSILQMLLQGVAAPPTESFLYYALVIMLDYVIAFTVLGLGGIISGFIKNKTAKVVFGSFVVVFLRFICHFLSGILIWGVYAPSGQSPYLYSLIYNGSYMGIELLITVAIMVIISNTNYFKKL